MKAVASSIMNLKLAFWGPRQLFPLTTSVSVQITKLLKVAWCDEAELTG